MNGRRKLGWRGHLGLMALGLLAASFWARGLGPEEALGRHTVDSAGSWWFQWWVEQWWLGEGTLTHTDMQLHPWGKSLLFDTGGNYVDSLLTLPLRWIGGPLFAWNALYMLVVASNAWAMGAVIWRRGTAAPGAAVGALAAALHPYVWQELAEGRPTQAMLAPMILAMDRGWEALQPDRGAGLRPVAWAGLLLALTGWSYWFYGLFGAMALVGIWVARPSISGAIRLTALAAIAAAITSPIAPTLWAAVGDQVEGTLPLEPLWRGELALTSRAGDWVSLATLRLNGAVGQQHPGHWAATGGGLGLVLLPGLWGWRRSKWMWIPMGLGLALALGPLIEGRANPLYLGLATVLPPLQRLYWPCRALALVVVASGGGVGRWVGRSAARALLVLGLLAVDLHHWQGGVLPTWRPLEGAEGPRWLAERGGVVLSLPWGIDHDALIHQTLHGLPMVNGMNEGTLAQTPPELREWLNAQPLLVELQSDRPGRRSALAPPAGVDWIILRSGGTTHHARSRGARQRQILEGSCGAPQWQGQGMAIFSCPSRGFNENE